MIQGGEVSAVSAGQIGLPGISSPSKQIVLVLQIRFLAREFRRTSCSRASELSGGEVIYFIRSEQMHAKSFVTVNPRDLIGLTAESFPTVPPFVMCWPERRSEIMSGQRVAFLCMAGLVQGAVLLLALVIGWIVGNPPWLQCAWSYEAAIWGILATIPMLLFLMVVYHSRARNLVQIRTLIREQLGAQLDSCGILDLAFVAVLAGISEEFLFRGVVEPYFSRWGPIAGLIVCNLLFSACHAVTTTYVILTAILGCYLSLTLRLTSEPNLLVPMICHSLYDFVAFLVYRNAFRRNHPQQSPNSDHQL